MVKEDSLGDPGKLQCFMKQAVSFPEVQRTSEWGRRQAALMGERIRNKEETMENDKEKEVSIERGAGVVLGTGWLDALRFCSGAALTGTQKLLKSHFADVVPWAGVALPWAKKESLQQW